MSNKIMDSINRVPVTARVLKLRQEVIDAKPILDSDRAMIVTEHYKATEDMHYIKRRATTLYEILKCIHINIWEDELIVGSHGGNGRRSAPLYPEFSIDWLKDELDELLESREQDKFAVPKKVKTDVKSIFPYWEGKSVFRKYRNMLPEDTKKIRDAYMFSRDLFERNGYGHTAYRAEKVLKVGIKGLINEVKGKLDKVDITDPKDLERKFFYEALLICFDGVISFAKRYSHLAKSMAKAEQNELRRKELLKIADVCNHVPENPARDIWDALQVIQFMQIVIQLETNGDSVSPGRMDQYLYEYFKSDLENGRYTLIQMQELLDCLWIKFNEIVKAQDTESIYIHPGFPMTPNVTAGGVKKDGSDATNEVSYMMLNAQEHIRMTNPQFTCRIHEDTSEEFKFRAAEIIEYGTGMPALFGDKGCISSMKRAFPDMPEENMRNFAIVGCVELAPEGFQGRVNGGMLNLARVVDLAMNNGVDRLTGNRLGPATGDSNKFESYEMLFKAVKIQMDFMVRHQVINALIVDYVQRENTPHLFLSSLISGCIDKGRDMTWGGSRWGGTPINVAGIATSANAMSAVKKLVFEEKKYDFKEINDALNENFTSDNGREIQKDLLSAPKYGNDDEFADRVMVELLNMFFKEIEKHKDIDGRNYSTFTVTLGGTVPQGWKTGATADGRKSGMPVSDSFSPANEGLNESPTTVLLSAGKVDQSHFCQGNILNLKFSESALASREAKRKLMDMVSVYFNKLGGQEIQFNVVNAATLKDAQANPENYKDLIIRVAGYSARFIELARDLQNDIIARTEHEGI